MRPVIVQLETYTTIKKHELRADRWVSIGSMARGNGMVHAYSVQVGAWRQDAELDEVVEDFKRELQRTTKKR